MKLLPLKLATLMLVAGTLFTNQLFSQQTTSIELTGTRMRAPLDVLEGKTIIQLCNLTAGNQYSVIVLGAAPGQPSAFELQAASAKDNPAFSKSKQPNMVRFTANEACMDLELLAVNMQPLTTIPIYVSVQCENCPEDKTWLKKFVNKLESANMTTAGNVNPESLIKNTLIGGGCFEVDNVTASGVGSSRGTFANGSSSIGIENGIVLCTGPVSILPGPNSSNSSDGGFNNSTGVDSDLFSLTTGTQFDLSTIEFDFTPTASQVQFDFVFGSEEYCEYVNTQYNDVFGFFISGPGITGNKNIAFITGTNTPVTTNNVNHLTNSAYYVNNSNFFFPLPNCLTLPVAAEDDCELDGWTSVFTAVADVIPCSTYHIKLAIADIGDASWSSAVFLRANSFDAGGSAVAEAVYAANQSMAPEACDTSFIRFVRDNSDDSEELIINFVVDSASTATPGDDYAPLISPVVIPAGQSEILVPVTIFGDGITEGTESIILLLDDPCVCSQTELTFLIQDNTPLEIQLDDQTVCQGNSVVLTPTVEGGLEPYFYNWSTGDTTLTLNVPASGPEIFELTVTDFCMQEKTAVAVVETLPLEQVSLQIGFCPGDSVEFNGNYYSAPTTILDTLPGANGNCDTILTVAIEELSVPILSDTIIFCAGDTVTIGGVDYAASGTVMDTLPGLNGSCDTIITYTLKMLPQPTRSETIEFCPGETVTIGGVQYTSAGTVELLQPGLNGECDTLVTYTLEYLTPAPSTVSINCPADYEVTISTNDPPVVQYDLPTFSSDCICPGVALELNSGFAPGSTFPVGVTQVCYVANDSCGNSASCCFDVRIAETEPCDIKEIGCVKFELLTITKNMADEKSYTVRVTNNCNREMVYIAFELPNGLTAVKPLDNSTYLSPGGRNYSVRNPNFSPFYSVRFSTKSGGIANGESDVFRFTLPPQANPSYIHCVSKLVYQSYYEAYLNTFFCPVGMDPDFNGESQERSSKAQVAVSQIQVYPNPTDGKLFLDVQNWQQEQLQGRVLNSRGQLVWEQKLGNGLEIQEIQLPEHLAEGLYLLELVAPNGERQLARFVLRN